MEDEIDRKEIKKIFGVLNSGAQINLKTFKEKVHEYKTSKDQDNDNILKNIGKTALSGKSHLNHDYNENSSLQFNPTLISSPKLFIENNDGPASLEETYESTGEDTNSPLSDYDDGDMVRPSRLRLSFRGSRRFSRHGSLPMSGCSSPAFGEDCEEHEEHLQNLRDQLEEKQTQLQKYEENLLNDSINIKTLEDKLDELDNINKELAHELDNSKVNIKNLESHMIYLDDKIASETKELVKERRRLDIDREKLSTEKDKILIQELDLEMKREEYETLKSELLSHNHILQSEISDLVRDNRDLQEKLEHVTEAFNEKFNKLSMENIALKELVRSQEVKNDQPTSSAEKKERRPPSKRNQFLMTIITRILLRSGLLCAHETLVYIRAMLTSDRR